MYDLDPWKDKQSPTHTIPCDKFVIYGLTREITFVCV